MPEYLPPGVYVEESDARRKTIVGVATSTAGFAGMTRYGPVDHPGRARGREPGLLCSFADFKAIYGGVEALVAPGSGDQRPGYTAHAARAFFMNGGDRLYVARVFKPRGVEPHLDWGVATLPMAVDSGATATWTARWPGAYGNVWVDTQAVRSANHAYAAPQFGGAVQVRGASSGSIIEVVPSGAAPPTGNDPLALANLAQVTIDPSDGRQVFSRGGADFVPGSTDAMHLVSMRVVVTTDDDSVNVYEGVTADLSTERYIGKVLRADDPEDENAVVFLAWDPATATGSDVAARLMVALQANSTRRLSGGHDGAVAMPSDLAGTSGTSEHLEERATGLAALSGIAEIAIVALPDGSAYADVDECAAACDALIAHAETLRYRLAVIDSPSGGAVTEVRSFRGRFDSSLAALYYPWLEVLDPARRGAQDAAAARLKLPPCGFVAGVFARTDKTRGVFEAPANQRIEGIVGLERDIDDAEQQVLNPEGINALRHFEGRGDLVWGARTLSSDPRWIYVSVRRLLIYLEHSIDNGTQWAAFEPNSEKLWNTIRRSVEAFLYNEWKAGALRGGKPEEAYSVRCDRTTMSQDDIDKGRLVCLVGVAPVRPSEFVILGIGQWTADASVR